MNQDRFKVMLGMIKFERMLNKTYCIRFFDFRQPALLLIAGSYVQCVGYHFRCK